MKNVLQATCMVLVLTLVPGNGYGQGGIDAGDVNRIPGARSEGSDPVQADWKGVRAGKSTRAQVESLLGRPESLRNGEDGSVQYIYPPLAHLGFNRIVFDVSGVVSIVGIGKFAEGEEVSLQELSEKYGEPRRLSKRSHRDFNARQSILQFPPEAGLWVVADEESGRVFGATFYDPATEPDIPIPQKAPAK